MFVHPRAGPAPPTPERPLRVLTIPLPVFWGRAAAPARFGVPRAVPTAGSPAVTPLWAAGWGLWAEPAGPSRVRGPPKPRHHCSPPIYGAGSPSPPPLAPSGPPTHRPAGAASPPMQEGLCPSQSPPRFSLRRRSSGFWGPGGHRVGGRGAGAQGVGHTVWGTGWGAQRGGPAGTAEPRENPTLQPPTFSQTDFWPPHSLGSVLGGLRLHPSPSALGAGVEEGFRAPQDVPHAQGLESDTNPPHPCPPSHGRSRGVRGQCGGPAAPPLL